MSYFYRCEQIPLPLISWNNEWLALGGAQPPGTLLGLTSEKGEGYDGSVGEGCDGKGAHTGMCGGGEERN
jgi:hypothetical protein